MCIDVSYALIPQVHGVQNTINKLQKKNNKIRKEDKIETKKKMKIEKNLKQKKIDTNIYNHEIVASTLLSFIFPQ